MIALQDVPQALLLKREDAARLLGLSDRQLADRTRSGEIPCIRLSERNIRYSIDDLRAWIATCQSSKRRQR